MAANLIIAPYRVGGIALTLDLQPCFVAEARIHEISFADKQRAKDLFSEFTRAYIYASKLHAMCKLHVFRATTASRRRRSIVLIDIIPGKVAEKGLSTSRSTTGAADIREAFIYTDEEYLACEDARAALEAAEQLMFGKMMAFREAADACKQMLSPDDRPRLNNAEIHPNAHGTDAEPNPMQAYDEATPIPNRPVEGFGTPGH